MSAKSNVDESAAAPSDEKDERVRQQARGYHEPWNSWPYGTSYYSGRKEIPERSPYRSHGVNLGYVWVTRFAPDPVRLLESGGQRRDRTADAGPFQGRLAMALSGLESADIIETISVVASSI